MTPVLPPEFDYSFYCAPCCSNEFYAIMARRARPEKPAADEAARDGGAR